MLTLSEEPGEFILQKSLCEAICGSIGAKQYRKVWVKRDDTMVDVLEDGNLACAWYVSNVLYIFGLVGAPHTWVDQLIADLYNTDWASVEMPEPGCVVVWEPRVGASGTHRHVGFYVGNGFAVSTSDITRTPVQHLAHDGVRGIELCLQHPLLQWSKHC